MLKSSICDGIHDCIFAALGCKFKSTVYTQICVLSIHEWIHARAHNVYKDNS